MGPTWTSKRLQNGSHETVLTVQVMFARYFSHSVSHSCFCHIISNNVSIEFKKSSQNEPQNASKSSQNVPQNVSKTPPSRFLDSRGRFKGKWHVFGAKLLKFHWFYRKNAKNKKIRVQGRKALAYDALVNCPFRKLVSLSTFTCDVRTLFRLPMFCMFFTCFLLWGFWASVIVAFSRTLQAVSRSSYLFFSYAFTRILQAVSRSSYLFFSSCSHAVFRMQLSRKCSARFVIAHNNATHNIKIFGSWSHCIIGISAEGYGWR